MFYRSDIDGLRIIAIFLIVFYHIFIGVDIFLVTPSLKWLNESALAALLFFSDFLFHGQSGYFETIVSELSSKSKQVILLLGPIPPQPYSVKLEPLLQFNGHNSIDKNYFFNTLKIY